MRYTLRPILVVSLALLSGCRSGSNPLPVGTFTNHNDPTQVLELTLDPSQTPNVFIRISIETGVNKYFGKSVGKYTLKTQRESTSGKFVWAINTRDGSLQEVWLTADTGQKWTLTVKPDGSLVDSNGAAWKRREA